ncbi:5'-nucleotidase C-terminal domain-containing protein [Novosphingobium sp. MBES04]|uniref:5'-nucleotidase C-terminal domain-containing protein n=1 Tax=Novosphingobium sp. MBES04 TaxID=1206458 RepID=UPI001F597466|nr:5'-nucleotidase [Novosphingobium sp. MBES04]
MNSAGVRAPIEPGADGAVTFGQIFTVQPFGNTLMTRSFTGAQIKAILESGVGATPSASVLVPSSTLTYTIDNTRPAGDRITQLAFNGQPLDLAARYRVTVNSFLDQGGDGYVGLSEGTDPTVGGLDLDALEAWLSAVPVRAVPETPRVRVIE